MFTLPAVSAPQNPVSQGCPLNHGVSVVDQLLAAITRDAEFDAHALDVALDFRLMLASATDPEAILQAFFNLRAVAEERHYLACFRLRRWLETQFVARVRLDRSQPCRELPVRLEARTYRELCARCAFEAAGGDRVSPWVRVHFAAADARLVSVG